MNILNDNQSGIRKLDIDLINFFFNAKCAVLEDNEEHESGMFSTQQKLMESKRQLLDFVLSYKNRNSIFYIFFNKEKEQNLKIVVSNTLGDEPNELTKRFAIVIDENLGTMLVKGQSLSGKVLTIILNNNE